MSSTIDTDGRLGAAIKEIARGMMSHGKPCIRMQVLIGDVEATYEVRLIKVRKKNEGKRQAPEA